MIPLAEAATTGPDLLPSMTGALLRVGLVLIVLGVGSFALVRFRKQRGVTRRDLRVIDRMVLTRGASIFLLDVAQKRLLVGASESGVRLIADLGSETVLPEVGGFESVLADLPQDRRRA